MLTVGLQQAAAKLADLFPHFACMLNPRRNPMQGKKDGGGRRQNKPKSHSRSTLSKTQQTLAGKRKGNPAAAPSLDAERRLPGRLCLKVPFQAEFAARPGSSEQMEFTRYSPRAAFPAQSGASAHKPSASQTLFQFSTATAQDEWLRKWISRENKTRLSLGRGAGRRFSSRCWALLSSECTCFLP